MRSRNPLARSALAALLGMLLLAGCALDPAARGAIDGDRAGRGSVPALCALATAAQAVDPWRRSCAVLPLDDSAAPGATGSVFDSDE